MSTLLELSVMFVQPAMMKSSFCTESYVVLDQSVQRPIDVGDDKIAKCICRSTADSLEEVRN